MPTEVYSIDYAYTIDGEELELSPLKIKYMREFMDVFGGISEAKTEDESIDRISECVRIAMKQYKPEFSKSINDVQDNFDIHNIYKILEISAGIKIKAESGEPNIDQQAAESQEETWENLDLVKLETEVFLLGIWKNFDEMEKSISMPELVTILSTRRDLDYDEKKFMAAIQGIDLDEQSGNGEARGQQEWENLKAKVASKGQAQDANDILALQGQNAKQQGFGIGMGIDYEVVKS